MLKIFIVDCYKNPGLLKFIQTKIFFDAKNQGLHWANDVEVVDKLSDIQATKGIIINSNQFITTTFRYKYPSVNSLIDARQDPDLIEFDPDYDYDIRHRPPFAAGSKQLYILENLYKTVLRSKKLVYLDNTEDETKIVGNHKHFYGLASGWKSVSMIRDAGIDNFESITIYDKCQRQLGYQKFLHSQSQLPTQINIDPPCFGSYQPPEIIKEFWPIWHNTKVNFEIIDLFSTPVFPEHSVVWISNVFYYEPTIFEFGWEHCKSAQQRLIKQNISCTII